MEKAKRARTAETPKQPSLSLRLRAPYLYPDPTLKSLTWASQPTNGPTNLKYPAYPKTRCAAAESVASCIRVQHANGSLKAPD